jgi:hypothetical protein
MLLVTPHSKGCANGWFMCAGTPTTAMDMMRILVLLLFLTATQFDVSAQVEIKPLEFKISDSFEDDTKKGEAARFIATIPSNAAAALFMADVALSFEFMRLKSLRISTFGEWHRNNIIQYEQHVQQLGMGLFVTLWNELGNCRSCLELDLDVSARYSHNLISISGPFETGIYSVYLTPHWMKPWKQADYLRPTAISPGNGHPFSKVLQFSYVVFGGLEYFSHDEVLTPNLTARAELYPLSGTIQKVTKQYGNLVVRVSYTYREYLTGNPVDFDVGNLLTTGVVVQHKVQWNKNDLAIGAGYDYSRGPNPVKGLKNQEFSMLSVKLKLTLRAQRTFS